MLPPQLLTHSPIVPVALLLLKQTTLTQLVRPYVAGACLSFQLYFAPHFRQRDLLVAYIEAIPSRHGAPQCGPPVHRI
jgi:hypothetical protein